MDTNVQQVINKRIEKCSKQCEKNRFKVSVLDSCSDLKALLDAQISEHQTVTVGGSMTLFESGVIDYLQDRGDITYLDRYHCDDVGKIYRDAFTCDTYITSSNAVTMDGYLYNIDGNGNRVAALTFGPKKVIVIVGYNKIVSSLDEAEQRLKTMAAPSNAIRLNRKTPCVSNGVCSNCQSEERICSTVTVTLRSHVKDRIHIVFIKESLGY